MASSGASVEIGQSDQELVGSKSRIRKIRIGLIVGVVILFAVLIGVGIWLVIEGESAESKDISTKDTSLHLGDILKGTVAASRFNGTWVSDSKILYNIISNSEVSVVTYDVTNGNKEVLMSSAEHNYIPNSFEISPDKKYLLMSRLPSKLYRHSFLALYDVLDIQSRQIYPVTITNLQEKPDLLFAKWGPVGNAIIFNRKGNLFYKPQVLAPEIQLTTDGNDAIMNGNPDWVYEEEVFGSNTAFWMNPSGTKIAFIRFDDTPTHLLNLQYYGFPGHIEFQYPVDKIVSYPKAGSQNPFVKLYQINLRDTANKAVIKQEVLVPVPLNTEEHIITAVTWLDDDNILSVFMNRIQNRAYLQVSNETGRYQLLELKPQVGWVDLFTPPLKNKDGSKVALILPHNQGQEGDFRHLTLLSTKYNPGTPIALTSGKYVVQQILHWDYDTNVIFYAANTPNGSHFLHIYGIKAEKGETPQCLTCNIKVDGVLQTYFSAEFDSSSKHVVITSLGPNIPQSNVYKYSFENNNAELTLVREIENNNKLKETLSKIKLPSVQYHTIDLENGFTSKVLLLIPPEADLSGDKKYPMLVDVYGGPDSYSVVDKWGVDWGSYLASNHSVIYAKIDGRGSGLRGEKLLHAIYLKLGTVEIDDQIQTAHKLQMKLPYIDPARIGIWGWSYGGYASAMALAKDNDRVFKCAASVAPVTDWSLYDSIYTERYMALPHTNKEGYSKSRLNTLASKFNGKKYLLVHGTLDDNVHYQQAMLLARSLEVNDIMFKQISYPDEDHGLAGVRPHLYHSLDKFFGDCFKWK